MFLENQPKLKQYIETISKYCVSLSQQADEGCFHLDIGHII